MTIRAVMLIADGWQDEEGIYCYHRMLEEGWLVDIATPSEWRNAGEEIKGIPSAIFGKFGVPLKITKLTEELVSQDYDVVVIPGGFKSPDVLRMRPEVLQFVRAMFERDKIVAAICHAPWVCISAGIMKGRAATCYVSLKQDLINAGSYYTEQPVVVDRNLITAPHYKNNSHFMKEVVRVTNERFMVRN